MTLRDLELANNALVVLEDKERGEICMRLNIWWRYSVKTDL